METFASLTGKCVVKSMLQPEDCKKWAEKTIALKSKWNYLQTGTCLGVAWYKWLEEGMIHHYHSIAYEQNNMLEIEFPGLLEGLLETTRTLTGAMGTLPLVSRASKYGGRWGKFGITIIEENDPNFSKDDGNLHVHCDFEGLSPYPEMMFDFNTESFSSVLSLQTPESGGGLKVYPRRFYGNNFRLPELCKKDNLLGEKISPDLVDYGRDSLYDALMKDELVEPVYLNYKPGSVAVFDSFLPHAIMPLNVTSEHPYRIAAVTHLLLLTSPLPHWEYWF